MANTDLLQSNPQADAFSFVDGRNAVNFLIANYLVGSDLFEFMDDGSITTTPLRSLAPYEDLVAVIEQGLMLIPLEQRESGRYSPQSLEILRELLAIGDQEHRPDAPVYSIYGYLDWYPNVRGEEIERAVTVLLVLGADPTLLDRSGRVLHEIIPLSPVQWRTALLNHGYPLCNVNPNPNNVTAPMPALVDIADLVVQNAYQGQSRLSGLILTADELNQALHREARCHNMAYLNAMLDELQDILEFGTDPGTGGLNPIEQAQIQIFIDGLTRFRAEQLQEELQRRVHQHRVRRVGQELVDLPPTGPFPGGQVYQEAAERFYRGQGR